MRPPWIAAWIAGPLVALGCTSPPRRPDPPATPAPQPATAEVRPRPEGPSPALSPPPGEAWPRRRPDPEVFVCHGRLNRALTTAEHFAPAVVVRRRGERIELDGLEDAGLRAAMQLVDSYRMNATRYFVATTDPGVSKIDHSFFLYVNDEGRGLFELRSLSGSLRIAYYDLVCSPGA